MTTRPTVSARDATAAAPHPRAIGWLGTTALAMGGSNQSLFLIGGATGLIASQGSAAVLLLIVGLLLSWAAAFGWTELILMWPNRVGGIASCCAEAFRPYSPVLANLTGVCYWWGWVPTCGLTALLSASAIHAWYLPSVPVPLLASLLVLAFMGVNLCGVQWVTRLALPIATASALLAFLSGLIPLITGHVNWHQATTFHLIVPFHGLFGQVTSAMAGLYLIGFAAPAFEAAACHVGETVNPARNVPRAMLASGLMASVYFVALPVIWLGVLSPTPLQGDLAQALGPTFAPLLGNAARTAAIWFMMVNMFHGTIQPLAGASRTLMQLAEDGLLPRLLARRSRTDAPWVATLLTAGMAIAFLLTGDPTWIVAAANLTYLIGIALPNVAVWLLRKDAPRMARPYRAPRGTIVLGLLAAGAWGISTIFGFEQFGLPTVLAGLALAYSGAAMYAWRLWSDRRRAGVRGLARSLHLKLTGAMLLVLVLDGGGYLLAVNSVDRGQTALVAALQDIFVAVALLTISVGLVLPGMIGHAVGEVARGANRLATGTIAELSRAMQALGAGDLDAATARTDVVPVVVYARDEVGAMAASFNLMQEEVARAAVGLDGAREGLRAARDELAALLAAEQVARARAEEALRVRDQFLTAASHDLRTPLASIMGRAERIQVRLERGRADAAWLTEQMDTLYSGAERMLRTVEEVTDAAQLQIGRQLALRLETIDVGELVRAIVSMVGGAAAWAGAPPLVGDTTRSEGVTLTQVETAWAGTPCLEVEAAEGVLVEGDRARLERVVQNIVGNAVKYSPHGTPVLVTVAQQGERAVLTVRDQGVGIPAEELPRIFTHFYRASTSIGIAGTGIGLAGAKMIVEQHGGTITLESAPGNGTTVTVTLPRAASAADGADLSIEELAG